MQGPVLSGLARSQMAVKRSSLAWDAYIDAQ